MTNHLPLGVCVLPSPPNNLARTVSYPGYIHEILRHAGICYETVALGDFGATLPDLRVLVTVGECTFDEPLASALREWVDNGGAWLSVAGACGMADLFGVEVEPPAVASWGGGMSTLGEGYLETHDRAHPILRDLPLPLHFFNGIPVRPVGAEVLAFALDAHQGSPHGQRGPLRAALVEHDIGEGRCMLLAPDVTGSVVRIQQGVGITRDGVPAPDGTAPICDEVLKSGDGAALDWIFDRSEVPGVPGFRAFLHPIADLWREVLLRCIFYLCDSVGLRLPMLWLYPRDLTGVALLTHDTDGNEPDKARAMLSVLRELDIRSTWCVILPGYERELIADIRAAGHELAMHFDAMCEGCEWTAEEFARQNAAIRDMFGGAAPTTNKNHFLRWEGDTGFLEWCAQAGVRLDQSKGASKTGEAGYNFGTTGPYFPVTFDGTPLDVLEVPTPTQDLIVFAPPEIGSALTESVAKRHGVLHLLFHPAHIDKPGVADALRHAVLSARIRGFEWWTAAQLDAWERARRTVRWTSADDGTIELATNDDMIDATILVLDDENPTVMRWGFGWRPETLDLTPKRTHAVSA